MTRKPPIDVIRILRKENGYKCVVPGCEIPYIEYHHFNPPWHVENHHRPEGMIALCPEHHRKADGGSYTDEQLKNFKEHASDEFDEVRGRFEYLRYNILLYAGGNFFLRNNIEITINGKNAIWFEIDENGYHLLNVELFDKKGNIYFKIENNSWEITDNVSDVECPPSGKLLKVFFKNGDNFGLEFKELTSVDELEKTLGNLHPRANKRIENELPITVLMLSIKMAEYNIHFRKDKLLVGNSMFQGCFSKDNGVGFAL